MPHLVNMLWLTHPRTGAVTVTWNRLSRQQHAELVPVGRVGGHVALLEGDMEPVEQPVHGGAVLKCHALAIGRATTLEPGQGIYAAAAIYS